MSFKCFTTESTYRKSRSVFARDNFSSFVTFLVIVGITPFYGSLGPNKLGNKIISVFNFLT